MRYKVFYGTGDATYAVCYGSTEDEARYHFGQYNPNTAIVRVEESPDECEPKKDLLDLVDETDPEEAIRYLIDAIEDAGVAGAVKAYLYRHGFRRDDDEEDE